MYPSASCVRVRILAFVCVHARVRQGVCVRPSAQTIWVTEVGTAVYSGLGAKSV